ncbi:hypothetical protein F4677DRAFT_430194 [Hypoxylon crocopeplum]|nr:hypothetical protein F4677DRAFT_430194 [Hypoxylon crocopeplum]
MDPLSIIAGVAGISQAGASLSRAIYGMVSAVRNAPKEIYDIARGISDLSMVLRELRHVLRQGKQIIKRRLLRKVKSAVRRIAHIHQEIDDLLQLASGFDRLKWVFRRTKASQLLYSIEAHKTGINMVLQTMCLALQLKQLSRDNHLFPRDNSDEEKLGELAVVRQQAENQAFVSGQLLLDSVAQHDDTHQPSIPSEDEEESAQDQIEIQKDRRGDSSLWLYDLVFSSAANASNEQDDDDGPEIPPSKGLSTIGLEPNSTSRGSLSTSVTVYQDSGMEQLQRLAQTSIPAESVVNELLSEWTTLTEDEINSKGKDEDAETPPEKSDREFVFFKDAVGRKFQFPFHAAKEWVVCTYYEAVLAIIMLSPRGLAYTSFTY